MTNYPTAAEINRGSQFFSVACDENNVNSHIRLCRSTICTSYVVNSQNHVVVHGT